MSANEIHEGDIGTVFLVTFKDGTGAVDVSSATITKQIILKPPKGSIKTKAAVFNTDGVDGKIKYVTVANDLDEVGIWEIQARVALTSGDWKSDIGSFEVFSNL